MEPEGRAFGDLPRVVGEFGAGNGGPVLIVVSGVHGNEPAGVLASLGVSRLLAGLEDRLQGRVHFVAANLGALQRGVRYVDLDLNRAWTRERIGSLRSGSGRAKAEDVEQAELLELIEGWVRDAPGRVYLLDIHTTSGPGAAFCTVADILENREIALSVPVPLVLGLEELVEGTLHDWVGELGVVTLAFEAGQHDEPDAVTRARAAIWLAMEATGVLPAGTTEEAARAHDYLLREHAHLPRVVEMRYRHPVSPDDRFRMASGYRNFQPVRKGEVLAEDVDGAVVSPESARVLMPLYQAQGNDGFFVVREFNPFWLRVSSVLRNAGADRVVHWLPGIHRHPRDPDALVVNRRVARWYALQILHLLGFRRVVDVGAQLVVHRRGGKQRPPRANGDGR
jgi:succinylglutamate desuccinylase